MWNGMSLMGVVFRVRVIWAWLFMLIGVQWSVDILISQLTLQPAWWVRLDMVSCFNSVVSNLMLSNGWLLVASFRVRQLLFIIYCIFVIWHTMVWNCWMFVVAGWSFKQHRCTSCRAHKGAARKSSTGAPYGKASWRARNTTWWDSATRISVESVFCEVHGSCFELPHP